MKKTHRSLISALMLAGLLTPALLLNGCMESGGTSASVSEGAQVAKASVGVSVEFPAAGASAARIDENTTSLLVQVWDATNQNCSEYGCYGTPSGSVTLERPANGGVVNGVIENISPGETLVRVTQLDADGNALETVNVSANLVEGDNAMTVTMVRAAWVLEDAVVFNKTRSDDTTRLDSFSLIPDQYNFAIPTASNVAAYGAVKAAEGIGQNLIYGATTYRTVLKGSNLCSYDDFDDYGGNGDSIDSFTCGQSQLASRYYDEGGLVYFNRHDSANSSKNYAMFSAMDDDLPLTAASGGQERGWFAMSVGPEGEFLELGYENEGGESDGPTEISDPAVWNDLMISVTAGDTIEGNFIEWLERSYVTSNRSCYTQQWVDDQYVKQTITCPAQAEKAGKAAAKQRGSAFRKAAAQAFMAAQAKPGKSAANAQGCYLDLEVKYSESDFGGWFIEGQNYVYWYYTEDVTETLDLCRHPFVAKASQLLQADIDLVNGSDR